MMNMIDVMTNVLKIFIIFENVMYQLE